MTDELISIKKKVHALLSKTVSNGCSEHEAMSAAVKAGELMDFYNLQITDIDIRETKCRHLKVELNTVIGGKLDGCTVSIGKFCDCKTWFTRGQKEYKGPITQSATYNFFGLEQDIEMAEYIYKILDRAIEAELKGFKKSIVYKNAHRKKAASKSFAVAFCCRIARRLNKMKSERDAELAKKEDALERTGRAIMVIKQDHIEAEFESELGFTLTARKTQRRSYNADAYSAGAAAGDRVNLNKGVTQKSPAQLLANNLS